MRTADASEARLSHEYLKMQSSGVKPPTLANAWDGSGGEAIRKHPFMIEWKNYWTYQLLTHFPNPKKIESAIVSYIQVVIYSNSAQPRARMQCFAQISIPLLNARLPRKRLQCKQ